MLWKIEYKQGVSIGRTAHVASDTIRYTKIGDIWFCDYKDLDVDGNYQPKFILPNGSYSKVERLEEKEEKIYKTLNFEVKKKKEHVKWL